jgi:hypothetical protein
MTRAIDDSAAAGQMMVGAGFCMEKFEDSPVVYESFAEAVWSGVAPQEAAMPIWLSQYATRRYGVDSPSAQQAWSIIYDTFYKSTGEWGTSIRAWPPNLDTRTDSNVDVSQVPVALRLLAKAYSGLPRAGEAHMDYDIAMVGFAFMQALFEDYWTLTKAACSIAGPPSPSTAANITDCTPCNGSAAQQFELDTDNSIRLADPAYPGLNALCINASCVHECWPIKVAPCTALGADAVFNHTNDGCLLNRHAHPLDYGVYCPGCKEQLGLANAIIRVDGRIVPWQVWNVSTTVNGTKHQISTSSDTGARCCLTATHLGPQESCAAAIHRVCPGDVGNVCIQCVEGHAQELSAACPDLNNQMHGVCAAAVDADGAAVDADGAAAGVASGGVGARAWSIGASS